MSSHILEHKSFESKMAHFVFIVSIGLCALLILSGCNADSSSLLNINDDPSMVLQARAGERIRTFGTEQKAMLRDLQEAKKAYNQATKSLSGNIAKQWSDEDVNLPSTDTIVKYSNNYKTKVMINFANGSIRIESVDKDIALLKTAIVSALLLPQDPSNVDLYSLDEFKFDGKPFLAGLIKDNDGEDILTQWRANRYAEYLVSQKLQKRTDSKGKEISYVDMQMSGDYQSKAEHKYEDIVKKYARQYGIEPSLVLGIIHTESNFNPYAVSGAPAFGLMQIVPSTAGADAYELINGKKGKPTKEMLFNPETNIQYGVAYLSILSQRYLANISNATSKEYCIITAYNAGAGLVLDTFSKDRVAAANKINSLSSQKVYDTLRNKLDSQEGRRYLLKVVEHKKQYLHIK